MPGLILSNSCNVATKKPVIDTKIPAPRSDKVCLIHNHKPHLTLAKQISKIMCEKQFRGQVDDRIGTVFYSTQTGLSIFICDIGVDKSSIINPLIFQFLNLIPHQSHKRRNNDCHKRLIPLRKINCRYLEQNRFPGASRCGHNDIRIRRSAMRLFTLIQYIRDNKPL